MIQTAESAMAEHSSMLQRMRELAVQGANSTLSNTDRGSINSELQQLSGEMNSISQRTTFNGQKLLTGNLATQVASTSAVQTGTVVVAGTNTSISSMDVSAGKAGATYTLSNAAGVVTLSDGTNSQAITAGAIGAGGSQLFNFDKLGVKFSVASVSGDTGANVAGGLSGAITTGASNASATLQIGADNTASNQLNVGFTNMQVDTTANGAAAPMDALNTALSAFGANNGQTIANSQALITAVDGAIDYVSAQRSTLGAVQNRLNHTIANLNTTSENLAASDSQIRDVNVAEASAAMSRSNVLMQAGVSVLAQANQQPQLALKLLG
jgi:flagellin